LVSALIAPICGYRGAIEGIVVSCRDISEAVLEERMVLDSHKIEAIGNMAGAIAHDFSNWLGVISGHASAVADSLIPRTRPHSEALRIINAAERAGMLVKRLFSVARASNIAGEMKIERVALHEVVSDAIQMMEETFHAKQISFKVRNLETAPDVKADALQFSDCLINLFLNDGDGMPDGGTITIDWSEKVTESKTFVVLRVRDTGVGISRRDLEQIFDPFFTTKDSQSATGLGLTIVKSSLQRWGGSVKVRSQEGRGTSFRLFVPRETAELRKRPAVRAGGETILVVDDQKDLLLEMQGVLEKAGYKVLTANGGNECVSLYRKLMEDIHLLVIDVVMPEKDGKQVLAEILDINPTARIVVTSGFSRDYVRAYLKRGAWGFAQKPIDPPQFLGILRGVLHQKTMLDTEGGDGATA